MEVISSGVLDIVVVTARTDCICTECDRRHKINGTTYIVFGDNVWNETVANSNIIKRFKDLNPHIQCEECEVFNTIKDCIKNGLASFGVHDDFFKMLHHFVYPLSSALEIYRQDRANLIEKLVLLDKSNKRLKSKFQHSVSEKSDDSVGEGPSLVNANIKHCDKTIDEIKRRNELRKLMAKNSEKLNKSTKKFGIFRK